MNRRTSTKYDAMLNALIKIAAFDDVGASVRLSQTGSYSRFDEQGSVRVARETLAAIEWKRKPNHEH